ncbi:MAG: prepilin-type N-terminal cleavage/methylation domain-containing protein [Sandaracinus sp.]
MNARTNKRARTSGYTLVEVMLAVAILAVGATGILGLQGMAIRGNQEANEYATATRTVEFWLDRYRMDALAWRTGGAGTLSSPALFNNTELMRSMPAAGSTGWFVPVPASAGTFPPAAQLTANGNPAPPAGAPTPVYCTQANMTWVYGGTAVRVDVQTFWRRRGWVNTEGTLNCPAIPDRNLYHVVRASTLVRWMPENPRRETAP